MVALPGRIASYSGLIVTLALAASVALLYWMIIMPGQTPREKFGNSYDTYGATKIEIPRFQVPEAPPSEPESAPAAAATEPFETNQAARSADVPPAAVVAQQPPSPSASGPPAERPPTTNSVALPAETSPAPLLLKESDEPSTEVEAVYNDSSAAAYPRTDHPQAWDWTVLSTVDSQPNDGAIIFPVPQVARQPEPPILFQ
jgi:hypothetical protein